jgi:signal peptidase I
MRKNDGCGSLIFWLVVALLLSIISAWFGIYVIESDMPTWLKYLILS